MINFIILRFLLLYILCILFIITLYSFLRYLLFNCNLRTIAVETSNYTNNQLICDTRNTLDEKTLLNADKIIKTRTILVDNIFLFFIIYMSIKMFLN